MRVQSKKELRRRMLEVRTGLPEDYRARCSETICRNLVQLNEFRRSSAILFYMPFRGEADVRPAIVHAWQTGKTVLLPRVRPENRSMKAVRVNSFDELVAGAYGILEPPGDPEREVPLDRIDLVVVPGVAFDRRGYRLGYGGGYYDRFFACLSDRPVRTGVCFTEQLVETAMPEEHDQPMHMLVTPDQVLVMKKEN
jgi:5-formyltetrahydrofolate cyclo-ligase